MTVKNKVWLHIGAGAFHRAHQAWYLNQLIAQGDDSWHISLANVRDDGQEMMAQLAAQQGVYTLETVTPEGERNYEKITSINNVLPWDPQLSALVAEGALPSTRVIAFTVTEGGYYLTQNHELDLDNRDIKNDLAGGVSTLYGALSRILHQRMRANGEPVTLLCCDNVRHNGERFRQGFLDFLKAQGSDALLEWVSHHTRSPNTMVDRITPRPTADIAARVKAVTGIDDNVPVMSESFIQWVVEDDFINGRPALEQVGAELVESVLPYEEAKIRILNASHSGIAWAGTLLGLNAIDESIAHPAIKQLVWDFITEDVIPCLSPSPLDLDAYRDVVIERFSNPYIKDTNQRVAADGFSKIPGFIAPTLVECFERGQEPKAGAVVVTLFYLFLQRWVEGKLPYEYQDSMRPDEAIHQMFASENSLSVFASNPSLFGTLAHSKDFLPLLEKTHLRLERWLKSPEKPIPPAE